MAKKIEAIVSVTKKDIEQGKRESAVFCPIALAIKRRFPDARLYGVTTTFLSIEPLYDKSQNSCVTPLPKKVKNFIKRFDGGQEVKPIRFKLCFQ
jgi:hypothetical protein